MPYLLTYPMEQLFTFPRAYLTMIPTHSQRIGLDKLLCFLVGHLRILQIELQLHFLTPYGDLNWVEFLIMDVKYAKIWNKIAKDKHDFVYI